MSQVPYTENFPGLSSRRKLSDWAIWLDGPLLVIGALLSRTNFSLAVVFVSIGAVAVVLAMINELIQSLRTGITYTDSNGGQPFVTRRDGPNQFWLYFGLRILIAVFAVVIPAALLLARQL